MRNVLPNFNVNIALRTVKISRLFSKWAKAEKLSFYDTPDCNYHYVCDCGEDYIGMSLRPLDHRVHEHQQPSKGEAVFITKPIVKHTRKISQKQNAKTHTDI